MIKKSIFRIKRGSVIFTWLISYLVMLLIPIIIGTVIYVQTNKLLENEINNSNTYALSRVRQDIDGLLQDIQRILSEISLNKRIREMLIIKGEPSDIQRYNTREVIEDLKLYSLHSEYIFDFYIYFENMELIMSPGTVCSDRVYFNSYYKDTGISFESWLKTISGRHINDYFSLMVNGLSENSITYVHSIPLIDDGQAYANVVFVIDQSKILEDASEVAAINDGSIFIINENDEILAKTDKGVLADNVKYINMNAEHDILFGISENEKMTFNYITSNITKWKYVVAIPERQFWNKVDYVKTLMFVNIILCIIIGGLFMLFAIRKNYKPIYDILQIFGVLEEDKDEYSAIKQGVSKAINENRRTQDILIRHNSTLRINYLNRLLKGRAGSNADLNEMLEWHSIKFNTDKFVVLLFYIKDYGLFFDSDSLEESKGHKLSRVALTNVFEELISEKHIGYMTEDDEMMACIVNINTDGDGWFSDITNAVLETKKFLLDNFYMSVTVSISNCHGIEAVPLAYSEASEAMELKLMNGVDDVYRYGEIVNNKQNGFDYPLEQELQIISCIKAGDYNSAMVLLDEIFKINFENSNLSIQTGKCLVFSLVSTFIKTIDDVEDREFLEKTDPIERITACDSYIKTFEVMRSLLFEFCEYLGEEKKGSSDQLIEDVISYIKKNYNDINITVGSISDNFNIQMSFLSKVFKEQMGVGLLDYIHKYRITKVKELLWSQDMNLETVASMTGFSSVRTLARVFKKYEGITPGQFRNLNN